MKYLPSHMDLIYIPEMVAYGSFRSSQYRDYEQPWNKNYFDHGPTAYEQHCQRQLQAKLSSSKSCDLCKESKKRSLASYVKQKAHKSSCTKISEEEEFEDSSTEPSKSFEKDRKNPPNSS